MAYRALAEQLPPLQPRLHFSRLYIPHARWAVSFTVAAARAIRFDSEDIKCHCKRSKQFFHAHMLCLSRFYLHLDLERHFYWYSFRSDTGSFVYLAQRVAITCAN